MKTIELTQSEMTIVDDSDYEELSQYKWYADRRADIYYAVRSIQINGRPTAELMHRRILGLKQGDRKHTDHINGNGLDNRRGNLRVCTRAQNIRNQRIRCDNTSGYKGVYWEKGTGKWHVQIVFNSRKIYLGLFNSLFVAALAYNAAALKYHGKFARLNEIEGSGDV